MIRAQYDISSEAKAEFLEKGYLRLTGAFPRPLLERWRALAARLETEGLAAHVKGEHLEGARVSDGQVRPQLTRYDDIHRIDPDAVLDLLACPGMLAIARELCGQGAVPLQLDILYKHQHPHAAFKWHQDAPHPRGFPYLNVGLYLDDAPEGDGCLRYVPGTQFDLVDIDGLSREHGWEIPGVVEVPARAGDILVQDMMSLHGSQPKRSPGVRRTIYVELRPAAGILESGVHSEKWADLRRRWMGLVLRRAEKNGNNGWPDEWLRGVPSDLGSDEEELSTICEHWEPPIPAVYEKSPVEHEDYPVPADLR